MRRVKLTDHRARNLPLPSSGQVLRFDSEVRALASSAHRAHARGSCSRAIKDANREFALARVVVLAETGPAHAPGARDLAIAAITAARRGEDPSIAIGLRKQPEGLTLRQVWTAYQEAGFPKLNGIGHKRATTIAADRQRYRLHLEQQFGAKAVAEIDTAAARRWLDRIKT